MRQARALGLKRLYWGSVIAMLSTACASQTFVDVDDAEAVAAYFNADTAYFERDFNPGSVEAALSLAVSNQADAAQALEQATNDTEAPIRDKLATLSLRHYINRYAYADAARVSDQFDLTEMTAVQRIYANFPKPVAEAAKNQFEIPYENGRIPGKVNGRDVTIIFDTGAPNVGLDGTLVKELDLFVDRSVSRISRVPAYGLEFPVYGVLIDELTLGDITIRNVPANTGEVPEEQREAAAELKAATADSEVILGLDPLRNFVDVVEFDWDAKVLRITVEDDTPSGAANYVLNSGGAPVFQIQAGERETNLSYDSGAYGHLVGSETVEAAETRGKRIYTADWGSFSETLSVINIADLPAMSLWTSGRSFAESEEFNVSGVLGVLGSGQLRLDLSEARMTIANYDPVQARYRFPISDETIDGAVTVQDGERLAAP